jgi:hypothetical protein
VENERVAFDQVYAYPVVMLTILFENLHCVPKHFIARRRRINDFFYLGHNLVSGFHLTSSVPGFFEDSEYWSTNVNARQAAGNVRL